MYNDSTSMDKFNFLLGSWEMKYNVPKSKFSDGDIGKGHGEFKRILNNRYVCFDYTAKLSRSESAAHAIFAWDNKSKIYRYWWFENSGEFMKATCEFVNENTLSLNWHNSLLIQTFSKIENNKIILQMKNPSIENDYELILEVIFNKKK